MRTSPGVAALEVKLVEGGLIESLIGPMLIASAAVIAAIVAARTANSRQRSQLEHDRALRAQDHIRDTIDAAAESAISAIKGYTEFQVAIDVNEKTRSKNQAIIDSAESSAEEVEKARKKLLKISGEIATVAGKAAAEGSEVIQTQARLRLRLGQDDPIVTTLEDLASNLIELEQSLTPAILGRFTDDQRKLAERADQKATAAFQHFLQSCESWFCT